MKSFDVEEDEEEFSDKSVKRAGVDISANPLKESKMESANNDITTNDLWSYRS